MNPGRPPEPRFWTDQRMTTLVALVLRGGVLLAAAVTLVGGIGLLTRQGQAIPDYHTFRGSEAPYRSLLAVFEGVLQGEMPAIIELGVVLLIATPVARVLLTLIGFAVQRDRIYIVITSIVLAVLLSSLVFGGIP